VSEEQKPELLGGLLAPSDETPATIAPLEPAAPQFSSRREMRNSTQHSARRSSNSRSRSASAARSASTGSAAAPGKLSRRERALARKLSAAPAARSAVARPGASAPAKKKKSRTSPLVGAFVITVVAAMFGTMVMPAFAHPVVAPGAITQADSTVNKKSLQNVAVDASAAAPKVQRDKITATSEAQLAAQKLAAQRITVTALAGAYSTTKTRAPGDDYPWPAAGNTLSPLNYYYRQCVDFVAWRLNRDAGSTSAPFKWTWSNLTPNGGDASQWKAAWEAHGWKTSATPIVGSVAWFAGNHVAYVNAIQGKNVVIEEYNGISSLAYNKRTIPIDTVARFLYPPPS
jgi:surface antigen